MTEATTPPLVPEQRCAVEEIRVEARDGAPVIGVARTPRGAGPFPAVLLLHGGLDPLPAAVLRVLALRAWTMNRLLSAGYVTVLSTHRALPDDPAHPEALWDCLAFVEHVKGRPDVDPDSVVLFGSSGGSDLGLEVAACTSLAAVMAEEPATSLFAGILTRDTPKSGATWAPKEVWPDVPKDRFSEALQRSTREKIRRIHCPVRISQGDQPVEDANQLGMLNEILIPELERAGTQLEQVVHPGQSHGFGFVVGAAPEPVEQATAIAAHRFFVEMDAFFRRHLPTRPHGAAG